MQVADIQETIRESKSTYAKQATDAGITTEDKGKTLAILMNRAFGINYKLTGIGPNFQEDAGFVPRNDIVQGSMFNRYSWYGAKGARLETFSLHYNAIRIWRYGDFGSRGPIEGSDQFEAQFGWRGGWSLNATLQRAYWDFQDAAYVDYRLSQTAAPYTPIDRVGVYVPGGRALYPSTVLMTVVPAQVAGVREIVMASPPTAGRISDMALALAGELGIREVLQLGGAVAVAAMATEVNSR